MLKEKLQTLGLDERRGQIDTRIEQEITEAVRFAEESPFPDASSVMDYIYV